MLVTKTNLQGVFELECKKFTDERGGFVKTFNSDMFLEAGLDVDFKESFYSTSKQGVLRGMHFQTPPHDHAKLVYVTDGEILDVAVDVRKSSPTFGECFSTILSSDNSKSLYMESGFAHGFLTLSPTATVVYLISTCYSPSHDAGIKWNSFDFDWGDSQGFIISDRDNKLPSLNEI